MEATLPKAPQRFKVDILVKAVLRSFRAFIKGQYQKMFQRRYYYWIKSSLRKHTQLFFEEKYHIGPTEYKLHENTLLLLVHNTKTAKEIMRLTAKQACEVALLFKETFGQKPNKKNMGELFGLGIIQQLWYADNGYFRSEELSQIVGGLTPDQRQKLLKNFSKAQGSSITTILI